MSINTTAPVHFMWDMRPEEFHDLFHSIREDLRDLRDYTGAVFFGNLKLEFIKTEAESYCNTFDYGAEDRPGQAYAYLEDGTPYEERCEISDSIILRPADSFQKFAEDIEAQVIRLLAKYPQFIPAAIGHTDPNRWYPCDHPYQIDEITRDVSVNLDNIS